MKIAQIAPLWFPIPPKKYGGIERVVSYLTEELVKRGHEVTLFASGDSKTKGKLISITKKHLIAKKIPWQDWWWNNLNYSLAFEKAKDFDIIHSHWTPLGMYFQRFTKTPVLHTLHNIPIKTDHRWKIFQYYRDSNVVFLSKREKKNSPIRFKKEWVVYNGINLNQFKLSLKPKNHLIWIGRICQKKGIEKAILVAEKMGMELILAGQLQPMEENYFKEKIRPHLNSRIKYIGELSQKKLSNFYGKAKVFLYPFEWQEPFGLSIIEAMACGTPVIAFNRGSAQEVIKNGKTGFVVKNLEEMIKAIKKIDSIKRENCRKWVEENFTVEKMVENYENFFYKILAAQ